MTKIKIISFYLSLIFLNFLSSSCDLPHMPGPQPINILDVDFEPGLNILGILRLNENNPESFIYIEELVKTKIYQESENFPTVKNAKVTIRGTSDTTQFNFTINESIDSIRYLNDNFIPIEGETYHLDIEATTENGTLSLSAKTTIPTKPSINESSIDIQNTSCTFNLATSDDTYQYDIYLFFEEDEYEFKQSYHINENGVITIEFNYPVSFGTPKIIEIVGYDENLQKYLNASSGIIPQTYQESISTVEDGYGCFGALSFMKLEIDN